MYSVYALIDPRDQGIRYVGMSRDAWRRYAMHLLIPSNTEKDVWIQELRKIDLSPVLSILETVETKIEAQMRESHWIQHYLGLNAPLTNISKTEKRIVQSKSPSKKATWRVEMDSSVMEDIIKATGWTPIRRARRNNRAYLYVSRRQGKRIVERYVAALSKVEEMSPEQFRTLLLDKIAK